MKRLKVRFRPEALDDLGAIYRWVYDASRSPVTAQRFVDRIIAACRAIGDVPMGGRRRDDLLPGLRTMPFERSGVIAYKLEDGRVQITNLFFGGRDYESFYRSMDD